MKITATGMQLTSHMRQRIEWVCEKIENSLGARGLALLCDITAVKVPDGEFRVEIYLTGPEVALRAVTTAKSAMAAFDVAHDEIEREFFRTQGEERGKQKIRDFAVQQVRSQKKAEEEKRVAREKEPPRRVKGRPFGEESEE